MTASQQIFDAIGAQLILHRSFADTAPRVGTEYELVEIIGAGGFGLICRANQLALRRSVALKLFPLGIADDTGVREALREARSLARLEHPGIVTVYAAGESELIAGEQRLPCAYVEMQLIDGLNLRDYLAAAERDAGEVLALLCVAGRALAHAHAAGIVHRDFKPENLMVDRSGKIRVIDFGLALVAEAGDAALARWNPQSDAIGTRATSTGLVRGTPGYMAPEASQGSPRAASDQFALAVVIREALTGRHPFAIEGDPSGPTPRGGPELFAKIKPLIDRAMASSPNDRFASVEALCEALETLPGAQPQPKRKRRRWPTLLLATVLLGSLAAAGWLANDRFDLTSKLLAALPHTQQAKPQQEPTTTSTTSEVSESAIPTVQPVRTPSTCADLEPWMGRWQASSKVSWTEYAYQFDWRVDYEFELALAERCTVNVIARKYPPVSEGELPGLPIQTSASAVAVRDADGTWQVPLHFAFVEDTRTYASAEFYELMLLLELADESPRVRGAYRKLNEAGYWIRLGLLEAARDVAPHPKTIGFDALACAARCRIDCAGARAEQECLDRSCAALDSDPADLCGAPSYDFPVPMRAKATREALREGKDPFALALDRGGRAKQLADCARNAKRLAGRWGLWLANDFATLQLRAQECELAGTVSFGEAKASVAGNVTAAGVWVLQPAEPAPNWLTHALVLVGVGEHGPAFGTDTAEPPRPLRAFRIPH